MMIDGHDSNFQFLLDRILRFLNFVGNDFLVSHRFSDFGGSHVSFFYMSRSECTLWNLTKWSRDAKLFVSGNVEVIFAVPKLNNNFRMQYFLNWFIESLKILICKFKFIKMSKLLKYRIRIETEKQIKFLKSEKKMSSRWMIIHKA